MAVNNIPIITMYKFVNKKKKIRNATYQGQLSLKITLLLIDS